MTVSAAQWEQVERSLPFLAWRPAEDRPMLRRMALEFLAEKQVHGARGLAISDEMLLSIALQACLPVLHIGLDAYADWVGIVVYPGDFVIPRSVIDDAGVHWIVEGKRDGEMTLSEPCAARWAATASARWDAAASTSAAGGGWWCSTRSTPCGMP